MAGAPKAGSDPRPHEGGALLAALPKRSARHYLMTALAAGVLIAAHVWAWHGIGMDWQKLAQSLPAMYDFLSRTVPPDLQVTPTVLAAALETLQIALIGTTGGALLAFPLGFLAARNVAHPWLRSAVRTLLNAIRSIPLLLYALFFVAAVGLGPLAGTLAMIIYSSGMLGKFYSEAIEAIEPGPVEGIESVGATRLQAFRYGILPQVLHHFLAYTLYRFELNFREGTILGLVGAGGIGFYVTLYMRSFQYHKIATAVLIILVMVALIDLLSSYLRRRLI